MTPENDFARRRRERQVPIGRALPVHESPRRPASWRYDPACSCLWCLVERVAVGAAEMRRAA